MLFLCCSSIRGLSILESHYSGIESKSQKQVGHIWVQSCVSVVIAERGCCGLAGRGAHSEKAVSLAEKASFLLCICCSLRSCNRLQEQGPPGEGGGQGERSIVCAKGEHGV